MRINFDDESDDEPEVYDEPIVDKTTEHTTMQQIADQEVKEEEEENMRNTQLIKMQKHTCNNLIFILFVVYFLYANPHQCLPINL